MQSHSVCDLFVICLWPVCDDFQIRVWVASRTNNDKWQFSPPFISTFTSTATSLTLCYWEGLAKLCSESNHRLYGRCVTYPGIHGLENLRPLATMAPFAPNTFQPSATTQSFSPLQGCGLMLMATDDGHTAWDLRQREWYCGSVGLKMCIVKCTMIFSCRFALLLPLFNGDANTLGHRYAICSTIVHRHSHGNVYAYWTAQHYTPWPTPHNTHHGCTGKQWYNDDDKPLRARL